MSRGDLRTFRDQISKLKDETIVGSDNPNVIAHEIGHTLGLQHNLTYTSGIDETNDYFSPSGIMTLGPIGPPTYQDLFNLIKSRFDNKSMGKSNIEFKGEKIDKLLAPDEISPPTRENVTVTPKS